MAMLDLVTDLVLTIVLPAALSSAAVIAFVSFATRINVGKWKFGWRAMEIAVPVAVIAGLLVGNLQRRSVPYLPEDFGWEWLLVCAVAALIFEIIKTFTTGLSIRVRVGFVVVPLFLLAWVLMPTEWRSGLTLWAFAVVVALNSIAFAAARPSHPAVAIIAACAILGGASLVLICSANARISDAAVLIASAIAGLLVVSFRALPLHRLALMFAMAVPALMLNGYYQSYSEVPVMSYVLVALAPMCFFIGKIGVLRRGPQWRRTLAETALPLIAVGIGVALAINAEGLSTGDDWESDEPEATEKQPGEPDKKSEAIEP